MFSIGFTYGGGKITKKKLKSSVIRKVFYRAMKSVQL